MLELKITVDEQGRMNVATNIQDHDMVILLMEKVKFLALQKSMAPAPPASPILEARAVPDFGRRNGHG